MRGPAVALALVIGAPVAAQVPTGATVTVIGVVVDSVSGAPIDAARVSLGLEGPGVATNSLGRFTLPNVPLGTRRIVISRLGYEDLEATIEVTDPMGGVRFRISPDPVQLEGITSGGRSDDIRGRVVDADSGEPVPFATLTLTKDGVRKLGRRFRSTDTLGNFVLPNVSEGPYVLRVERPGYAPRLQQIVHTGDGNPFLITLSYDARRVAALAGVMAQFDARVAAMPKAAVITEDQIQTATMTMLGDYLKFQGPIGWGYDPTIGANESGRNAPPPPPQFYVDGVRQHQLRPDDYSTKEFYRIDILECRWVDGAAVAGGPPMAVPGRAKVTLAYTYAYIEARMLNPLMKDPRDPTLDLCNGIPKGTS